MKKLILITYGLTAFLFTRAQQPQANSKEYSFSLQQAIDFAMQNQLQIQNAVLDEQVADQKVKEITAYGLPQVSGSFDVKKFIQIPTQVFEAKNFNPNAPEGLLAEAKFGLAYNASAGISASQLLFDGSYIVGLQSSQVYRDLSRKATQRTKIEVSVAIRKAYYMALVNDERMKLLDANLAMIKKLMDDSKALNDNGFIEKIDVDRVTVSYNNLQVEREKINRLLLLSKGLLKYQMGMEQSATLILTDKLADVKFDAGTISAEKIDYSKRIEYSLTQTSLMASNLQLRKDKFSYLPSAFVYATASTNAMRPKFDIFQVIPWFPTTIVGATINLPIFGGGQKHYRLQQSKLNITKAENDLKLVQQSIDLELSNAVSMLQNAASSLETQKKNIDLAEEVYKTAKIKYDQGVGSNLEVLNAETSLKEAQTNYFNALYEALVAKIDYEKASGMIK